MSREQLNVRVPTLTKKQINELVGLLPAESQSHVIMLAVDRLYQEVVIYAENDGSPDEIVNGEKVYY